jgi:hypothetical protein
MDYASKYNRDTVPSINVDTVGKIHSIYSTKESEAYNVQNVGFRYHSQSSEVGSSAPSNGHYVPDNTNLYH